MVINGDEWGFMGKYSGIIWEIMGVVWDIMEYIWVDLITTELCSPEAWFIMVNKGNHPLLWPNSSG